MKDIQSTSTMNKVIDSSDEILELIETFFQIFTITSIPFAQKIFHKGDSVNLGEHQIIIAYDDLMIDDWRWYSLCRASDNALLGLQLFTDIKEIP